MCIISLLANIPNSTGKVKMSYAVHKMGNQRFILWKSIKPT